MTLEIKPSLNIRIIEIPSRDRSATLAETLSDKERYPGITSKIFREIGPIIEAIDGIYSDFGTAFRTELLIAELWLEGFSLEPRKKNSLPNLFSLDPKGVAKIRNSACTEGSPLADALEDINMELDRRYPQSRKK